MGILFSKYCDKCNGLLMLKETNTQTYDGLDWIVEYYTCQKCNTDELIYKIPDKSW